MAQQSSSHFGSGLKLLLGLAAIGLVAIVAKQFNLQAGLLTTLDWVKGLGPVGVLAYIGIYVLATVLFIPGSLLTLGGGALYGVGLGSLYVFMAASLGATLAFLIGRYLTRNWVAGKIAANPKFQAIDDAIAREGLKIVILTRLSPVFPFNLLNYALGISQVSLWDYLLGFVGMIPGTVMYVYIGSLAGSLAAIGTASTDNPQTQTLQLIIRILGFLATVAVTLYVTRIARKALDQTL